MPDLRDYTEDQKEIKAISKKLGLSSVKMKAPALVDLRQWCSPVEDQGNLGSCVLNNLALDFWSLLSMNWIESGQFGT